MKIINSSRNYTLSPEVNQELLALRNGKWQLFQQYEIEIVLIGAQERKLRSGLTFTPYANPRKCNAHCQFCSEELQRIDQNMLSAQECISNYDSYFDALSRVFANISPLKNIGLSLSGLEITNEPQWLLRLLDLLSKKDCIPRFTDKVLYTNCSGLYKYPYLLPSLKELKFNHLEISRSHYDEHVNQSIMRFRKDEAVCKNHAYESAIKMILDFIPVKNSCILTIPGINQISEVEKYLDWAISLGIKQVVFRELSRLDNSYIDNTTKQWIEENRVSIDDMLQNVMRSLDDPRFHWEYKYSNAGYYYYNEHYRYRNEIEVIFEASCYNELVNKSNSEVFQKLIFYSNGNLCGGWNPQGYILANYYNPENINENVQRNTSAILK